jgi:hypothetical protein
MHAYQHVEVKLLKKEVITEFRTRQNEGTCIAGMKPIFWFL